MLILLILLMLVPAMISVLLYEKFKGNELSTKQRVILLLIFAYIINLVGYATLWLRGWEYHNWSLGSDSSMTGVSFVVKYMAITFVAAVALPFVLSLVRIGKPEDQVADETDESDVNTTDEVGKRDDKTADE